MRHFQATIIAAAAFVLILATASVIETARMADAPEQEPPLAAAATPRPTPESTATPEPAATIYDIPLSAELQEFTFDRCLETNLDYELVLALMGHESNYKATAKSATNDYGIMQINQCNHARLKETLGITDFMDAKQSITAGTEILAQLAKKYEDPHQLLMAYNMGEAGARKLWEQGIYSSKYSRAIMALRAEIVEGGD